jgi:hypothetical protein
MLAVMTTHDLDRLLAYAATVAEDDIDDLGAYPDWFLAAVEARSADELPPQVVFAAYLLCARRDDPRLSMPAAFDRVDQEPAERLWGIATAFTLSCSLERLKRAGLLERYAIDDPFSLHGLGRCTFPQDDLEFYRLASSPEQLRQLVHDRMGRPTIH